MPPVRMEESADMAVSVRKNSFIMVTPFGKSVLLQYMRKSCKHCKKGCRVNDIRDSLVQTNSVMEMLYARYSFKLAGIFSTSTDAVMVKFTF